LNSSVYRARVAFIIVYPFADSQLWDTFGGGKIIMLRPANERMDVEEATEELIRSSFIEMISAPEEEEEVLVVPLAAAVFGQRKLTASPMKTAVQANTELLLNFGAAQKTDAGKGVGGRIERFFGNVASKAALDASIIEANLEMMEFLAQRYSRGWLLLARVYEESDLPYGLEKAKGYFRRFLENPVNTDEVRVGWEGLSRLCRDTGDFVGEVHALVELCSLPGTDIQAISNVLNRWNSLFRQQSMNIAGDERQILGRTLLEIFEANIALADATDMSRAAWVYLALHETSRAKELVRGGLNLEPYNEHCQKLASRLSLQGDLLSY